MACTTRETVTRTLGQFRKEGWITIEDSIVTVHQPDRLQALFSPREFLGARIQARLASGRPSFSAPQGSPPQSNPQVRAKIVGWESKSHMTRKAVCFSALLFSCCVVFAQTPAPARDRALRPRLPPPHRRPRASCPTSAPRFANSRRSKTPGRMPSTCATSTAWSWCCRPCLWTFPPRRHHHAQSATGPVDHWRRQDHAPGAARHHRAHAGGYRRRQRHLCAASQGGHRRKWTKRACLPMYSSAMRGGWVCVNSQRTLLRADAPGKGKKKGSDAELPFHIPLFSHSDKKDQQ